MIAQENVNAAARAIRRRRAGRLRVDESPSQREVWTPERCYITELLNTAELPDVSLALTRVEPGVRTQLHALRDVEETYVLRAGSGRVEVDGEEWHVAAGDHVHIPKGVAQRITNVGEGDLEFYCVCRPRFRAACYVNLEAEDAAEGSAD